jgi:hypothetical protein
MHTLAVQTERSLSQKIKARTCTSDLRPQTGSGHTQFSAPSRRDMRSPASHSLSNASSKPRRTVATCRQPFKHSTPNGTAFRWPSSRRMRATQREEGGSFLTWVSRRDTVIYIFIYIFNFISLCNYGHEHHAKVATRKAGTEKGWKDRERAHARRRAHPSEHHVKVATRKAGTEKMGGQRTRACKKASPPERTQEGRKGGRSLSTHLDSLI